MANMLNQKSSNQKKTCLLAKLSQTSISSESFDAVSSVQTIMNCCKIYKTVVHKLRNRTFWWFIKEEKKEKGRLWME